MRHQPAGPFRPSARRALLFTPRSAPGAEEQISEEHPGALLAVAAALVAAAAVHYLVRPPEARPPGLRSTMLALGALVLPPLASLPY